MHVDRIVYLNMIHWNDTLGVGVILQPGIV